KGARPAAWSERSSTTTLAPGWSTTSSATSSRGSARKYCSAPSSTGATSTKTWATGSSKAYGSRAGPPPPGARIKKACEREATAVATSRDPQVVSRIADHGRGVHDAVEGVGIDAAGQGGLAKGGALVHGLVRDGGGLVVADCRAQCGNQHQGPANELAHAVLVHRGALDAERAQL